MGCGGSALPVTPESRNIDAEIKKSRERMQRELKLLLLGTGASGKSTIAKQIKVIHLNGYSERERQLFTGFIFINILHGMKTLVKAMDTLTLEPSPELLGVAEELRKMTLQLETMSLSEEMGNKLAQLWADESIQKTWQRRSEFQVDDSIKYFMGEIGRLSQPGYVPSTDDVLHVRIKTTGLKEIQFAYQGFMFRVVDVGGQRSERRKWIHCFQDVTAILYVVALSDYDLMLEEDMQTNRMVESLELFEKVVNNRWFEKVNVLLFLNKKDLFEEKIKQVPLTVCFKEYGGDPHDYDECVEFITQRFRTTNTGEGRTLFTYQTCATNTSNIKKVWDAVHSVLVNKSLQEARVGGEF